MADEYSVIINSDKCNHSQPIPLETSNGLRDHDPDHDLDHVLLVICVTDNTTFEQYKGTYLFNENSFDHPIFTYNNVKPIINSIIAANACEIRKDKDVIGSEGCSRSRSCLSVTFHAQKSIGKDAISDSIIIKCWRLKRTCDHKRDLIKAYQDQTRTNNEYLNITIAQLRAEIAITNKIVSICATWGIPPGFYSFARELFESPIARVYPAMCDNVVFEYDGEESNDIYSFNIGHKLEWLPTIVRAMTYANGIREIAQIKCFRLILNLDVHNFARAGTNKNAPKLLRVTSLHPSVKELILIMRTTNADTSVLARMKQIIQNIEYVFDLRGDAKKDYSIIVPSFMPRDDRRADKIIIADIDYSRVVCDPFTYTASGILDYIPASTLESSRLSSNKFPVHVLI